MKPKNEASPNGASVDPEERARFDQFARIWWDETGAMWPLHRLNSFRTGFIVDIIRRHFHIDSRDSTPFTGLSVLDIGCGGGILSETMANFGCSVHGVDISERNIEVARQHAMSSGLDVVYDVGTAESLASEKMRYDIILNMEVVEHVADLKSFMSSCNSMVNANGLQFVATINRNPWSWFIAIFGAERVLGWLPTGTHQYRKLVKPSELLNLLEQDQFSVTARTGVAVNPFNRQMSATKSELVNYMLAARRQ